MASAIDILINAKDMTGPGATSAKANLASLSSSADATAGRFSAMTVAVGTAVGNLATSAISKLGEMATSVVTTGISFNNMKQQSQIAFETMLGSGSKAKAFLDDLQQFAAKTPFEFPDLVMASQRMLAMGFESQKVLPTLTAIGDAVAGLGGSSAMVDRVTTALGQMQAKGKATGEEMMQLTEAGIPAWEFLAKKIGVSIPEAMEMVTKGSVKADVAIGALVEGMNTKFGGLMEKQSTTFGGLLSTIKDVFAQVTGQVLEPVFNILTRLLQRVADFTTSGMFREWIEGMTASLTKFADWAGPKFLLFFNQTMDAIDFFRRVWREAMTGVQDNTLRSFEAFDGFAGVLTENFLPTIDKVVEGVGRTIDVLKIILKPVADAIAKFVKFEDVAAALGIMLGGPLLAAFGGVLVGLAQFLAPIAAVVAAVAALRWAWENDFGNIRTFTLATVGKISDWFFKESGIWKGTWEETWEFIYKRVDRFIRIDIYNAIVGTWAQIKFEWTFHTTRIIDQTETWAQKVYDTLAGWANDAIAVITNWKDRFIEFFQDAFGPALKEFSDWSTTSLSTLERWRDWGIRYIKEWADDIAERFGWVFEWWDDHVQPFVDKGRAIIQGLWNGIKEKWASLRDWFTGVWGDLTDRFKRFFGIASPSTLFAGYGQNLMEGLAGGIAAYQGRVQTEIDSLTNSITSKMELVKGAMVKSVFEINNAAAQLNINPALLGAGAGGTGKIIGYGPNGELILEGITNLPTYSKLPPAPTPTTPSTTIGGSVGGPLTAGGTSIGILGGISLSTPDINSAKTSAEAAAQKVKDFIAGLGEFLGETVNTSTTSKVFHTLARDKENNAIGIVELRAADTRIRDEMAKLLGVSDLYGQLGENVAAVMEKITGGTDLNNVAGLLQSAVDFRTLANYYSTSDYANVLPDDARLTGGATTNNYNITLQGSSNASADVLGIVELLGSLQGTASP